MVKSEMILRVAFVSDELTQAASEVIARTFGGFFLARGQGGYVNGAGTMDLEDSIAWHIGTNAKDSTRLEFLIDFARSYCKLGDQESVYCRDTDGTLYLGYVDGTLATIPES